MKKIIFCLSLFLTITLFSCDKKNENDVINNETIEEVVENNTPNDEENNDTTDTNKEDEKDDSSNNSNIKDEGSYSDSENWGDLFD